MLMEMTAECPLFYKEVLTFIIGLTLHLATLIKKTKVFRIRVMNSECLPKYSLFINFESYLSAVQHKLTIKVNWSFLFVCFYYQKLFGSVSRRGK